MINIDDFLSKDEPEFLFPFVDKGFIYATNRHILIRVIGDAPNRSNIDKKLTDTFNRLLSMSHTECRDYDIQIPESGSCKTCEGTGVIRDCEICAGDGFTDNGIDCHVCGGKGYVAGIGDTPCFVCYGDKLSSRSDAIAIGGTHIAAHYLRLILALPNVEIAISSTKYGMSRFRFDGGVGAVMPIRA